MVTYYQLQQRSLASFLRKLRVSVREFGSFGVWGSSWQFGFRLAVWGLGVEVWEGSGGCGVQGWGGIRVQVHK